MIETMKTGEVSRMMMTAARIWTDLFSRFIGRVFGSASIIRDASSGSRHARAVFRDRGGYYLITGGDDKYDLTGIGHEIMLMT